MLDVMDRHGVLACRACELADLHRSVFQYQKQDRGDVALRKQLRALANARRRFGYRRLGIVLAREGEVTHKTLFGLCGEDRLSVCNGARSQACAWHTQTHSRARQAQPAMVIGLCVSHLHRRSALPHSVHRG